LPSPSDAEDAQSSTERYEVTPNPAATMREEAAKVAASMKHENEDYGFREDDAYDDARRDIAKAIRSLPLPATGGEPRGEAHAPSPARVREETVEECARIADGYKRSPSYDVVTASGWIADDIRALASPNSGEKE